MYEDPHKLNFFYVGPITCKRAPCVYKPCRRLLGENTECTKLNNFDHRFCVFPLQVAVVEIQEESEGEVAEKPKKKKKKRVEHEQ